MAKKKIISDDIRKQVAARVAAFNQATPVRPPAEPSALVRFLQKTGLLPPTAVSPPAGTYIPRFRGAFLYLGRIGLDGQPYQICRLKWDGDMDSWEFAIDRHGRNKYDPDEWFFPGAEEVNGTVEGAMRAGLEAYPV